MITSGLFSRLQCFEQFLFERQVSNFQQRFHTSFHQFQPGQHITSQAIIFSSLMSCPFFICFPLLSHDLPDEFKPRNSRKLDSGFSAKTVFNSCSMFFPEASRYNRDSPRCRLAEAFERQRHPLPSVSAVPMLRQQNVW